MLHCERIFICKEELSYFVEFQTSLILYICAADWCTEKTVGIQATIQWLLENQPVDDFIVRLVRQTSQRKLRLCTNKMGGVKTCLPSFI